jgi:GTP-binding protein Era
MEEEAHRAGHVVIIGRPNVGKSTLLNLFLSYKLSIVSSKPQTTRHQLLGILSGPNYQIAFLDTPGFMKRPKDLLDRRMLAHARDALESSNLVLLLVEPHTPGEIEHNLIELLKHHATPVLLGINKVDRIKKEALLPIIEEYRHLFAFKEMVPVSARTQDGTTLLLELIIKNLPLSSPVYDKDTLTDRAESFLAAELIREQLFRLYGQEIPYDTAVEIEDFREAETHGGNKDLIQAMIYVNKPSQQRILIGGEGKALKEVGIAARVAIEALLERPVFLDLWVKVRTGWRQENLFLEDLGY